MRSLTRETFKIYYKYARQQAGSFVLGWLFLFFYMAADVYRPTLFKRLFDGMANYQPADDSYRALLEVLFLIFVLGLTTIVSRRVADYLIERGLLASMKTMYTDLFRYVHGHSETFFNNQFTGSLVKRVNRFVAGFDGLVDIFVYELGQVVVRSVMILIALAFFDVRFALVATGWLFVFVLMSYAFAQWKLKYDLIQSERDTALTGQLADTLANHTSIQLFNGLRSDFPAFAQLVELWRQAKQKRWNFGTVTAGFQASLMMGLEVYMLYYMVNGFILGHYTLGDIVLLQGYIGIMFGRMWEVGRSVQRLYEHVADANEMTEILIKPHEIIDHAHAGVLHVPFGEIDFRNITFKYQKENVFKKFNLTIRPGEKIGLVGASGSGKSTFVKLLLRFYELNGGGIYIDDQNIAEVTQESLREAMSLVPQESVLFHRTIMENIRYAKPGATDAEVMAAAKKAFAHDFIKDLPDGYGTFVGERGVKLSGGQKQRVAIARAILKDAPILILDEATSSLDSESEMYIQEALKELMNNKTVIVIAHRLSTIRQMDRIVVLDNGKILEQGSHRELLDLSDGKYQKLWGIQAGSFNE